LIRVGDVVPYLIILPLPDTPYHDAE
jgi:hypothetical protein